jgi:urate oxidase
MALTASRHGKARVRVMRVCRDGDRHEVRELTIKAMLAGGAERSFTDADNSKSVSTDTLKNIVNVVARENLALDNEPFCEVLAKRLLAQYPLLTSVRIEAHETKWQRLALEGKPHAHSFLLDGNGHNTAEAVATPDTIAIASGVSGFTFMKTTESGWDNILKDEYTTLPETRDRIAATSMDASWRWRAQPSSYPETNAKIMTTMLKVFASTYSASLQDSLYRMGIAALAAVPEIEDIALACPNKHYLPVNLAPFKLDNMNQVFLPTDEPHGQIECTVTR